MIVRHTLGPTDAGWFVGSEDLVLIRVMIVDENEVFRLGLEQTFEAEGDIKVVADFDIAQAAIENVAQLEPDVVLLSVGLTDMRGFEACIEILETAPNTRMVMTQTQLSNEGIVATIMAGGAGYLPLSFMDERIADSHSDRSATATPRVEPASSTTSSRSVVSSGTGSARSRTRTQTSGCRASIRRMSGSPGTCRSSASSASVCGRR